MEIYSSNPALTLLWLASTPLLLGENPASWKTWGRNETIAAEQKKWNVPIEKCFLSDSRPMPSVSYWQSMNVCHLKAPILEECLQECEECGWKAPPEQHIEHTWDVTRHWLTGVELGYAGVSLSQAVVKLRNFHLRRWGSFSGARVCIVAFKRLTKPLRSHIWSFGILGQLFKIPPLSAQKLHSAGGRVGLRFLLA